MNTNNYEYSNFNIIKYNEIWGGFCWWESNPKIPLHYNCCAGFDIVHGDLFASEIAPTMAIPKIVHEICAERKFMWIWCGSKFNSLLNTMLVTAAKLFLFQVQSKCLINNFAQNCLRICLENTHIFSYKANKT